MTESEAERAFFDLLDSVERGEAIAVTRGGRVVAEIHPAAPGSGASESKPRA